MNSANLAGQRLPGVLGLLERSCPPAELGDGPPGFARNLFSQSHNIILPIMIKCVG
jgi:hypothetical protein